MWWRWSNFPEYSVKYSPYPWERKRNWGSSGLNNVPQSLLCPRISKSAFLMARLLSTCPQEIIYRISVCSQWHMHRVLLSSYDHSKKMKDRKVLLLSLLMTNEPLKQIIYVNLANDVHSKKKRSHVSKLALGAVALGIRNWCSHLGPPNLTLPIRHMRKQRL